MKISTKVNENLELNSDSVYVKDVGGYDGTNPSQSGVKDLVEVINDAENMVEITWADLKALRDGGNSGIPSNWTVQDAS